MTSYAHYKQRKVFDTQCKRALMEYVDNLKTDLAVKMDNLDHEKHQLSKDLARVKVGLHNRTNLPPRKVQRDKNYKRLLKNFIERDVRANKIHPLDLQEFIDKHSPVSLDQYCQIKDVTRLISPNLSYARSYVIRKNLQTQKASPTPKLPWVNLDKLCHTVEQIRLNTAPVINTGTRAARPKHDIQSVILTQRLKRSRTENICLQKRIQVPHVVRFSDLKEDQDNNTSGQTDTEKKYFDQKNLKLKNILSECNVNIVSFANDTSVQVYTPSRNNYGPKISILQPDHRLRELSSGILNV